jgi:hypothetical protein
MRYTVIKDDNSDIAVVFHDYLTSYFVVNSTSEAFRRAFDSAVKSCSAASFGKQGSKLVVNRFGPNFPTWLDEVLRSFCGKYWRIAESGSIPGEAFIEDITCKHLSV